MDSEGFNGNKPKAITMDLKKQTKTMCDNQYFMNAANASLYR